MPAAALFVSLKISLRFASSSLVVESESTEGISWNSTVWVFSRITEVLMGGGDVRLGHYEKALVMIREQAPEMTTI